MKILYLLTCLLLYSFINVGQNIKFDYDNSGNRILRKSVEALPVTLINFNASKQYPAGNDAPEDAITLLTWQTSAERNADRFSVQRSVNGKSWLEIGSLPAKGEFSQANDLSHTDYAFTDKTPVAGENLYRLKMIDRDDSFAYSQIRSLRFDFDILIYPNPVNTLLTLKSSTSKSVQLFDNTGKLIYNAPFNASSIDVSALPVGIYILQMTGNDGNIFTKKIIKQ